ncbi:MAG: DUF2066 domain-containing protein [Pseudomonadota bacterium]
MTAVSTAQSAPNPTTPRRHARGSFSWFTGLGQDAGGLSATGRRAGVRAPARGSQVLFVLLALLLSAATVANEDLYEGVIPVPSQSEADRRAALPLALTQVLGKLSGERELPPSPELDAAVAGAPGMVVAFGYREVPVLQADGSELSELLLVANFAPPAVDGIVRELGLRRWRIEREPVVLWVVVDDRRNRALMPVEYQLEFDGMEEVAELRGLPVAWPGLSQELMAQVDVQLLWGGYTEQLVGQGSNTTGVAIVAARREGAEWNVRWTYADQRTSTSWRTRSPELGPALDEGVHLLADLVASINAIGPAGQGLFTAELVLADLGGSGNYARSLNYLIGLSLVDGVDVLGVGPAGVRLALQLNAAPSYLEEVLRQDGVLEAGGEPGMYRFVR